MTKEETIQVLQSIEDRAVEFPNMTECDWVAIAAAKRHLQEPVSEELEEAAKHYLYSNILYDDVYVGEPTDKDCIEMFKAGAKWQKENLWKPADGDDLPEIDREVIVLLNNGRVVFGHRPPEYWDGKNIITGKVTRNYVERYDKGLWNIPNVKYWLDVELPK